MRGAHTGEMSCSAGRGDYDLDTPRLDLLNVLCGFLRGTMRGENPALMGHFEAGENLACLAHDLPVRLATHQDRNQRIRIHGHCPDASVNPAWPLKDRNV